MFKSSVFNNLLKIIDSIEGSVYFLNKEQCILNQSFYKKCDVNLPFGKIAFNVAIHDQQIHKHGEVNYKKSMLVLTSTKKMSE